ncbi:MAG: thioredoxin family protein [Fimbriimonadaceae bacterium]|nr:MAG: thioredoxin family protein [Fimbriimonadaceae bacterium]
MKNLILAGIFMCAFVAQAEAPRAAETTETILKNASIKAEKEHKNILVMFHASWCGWCHKLDDFLEKSEPGKKVAAQFVTVHITVMENDEHKSDENAGGMELLTKLGGDKSGIPYYAIMDSKQKTLITSNPNKDKPGNIGYPAAADEIAHFMKMLKMGAPKLAEADRKAAEAWLTETGKKLGG